MELEFNEITVLMTLNSIGILALMGMFLHLSFVGIFGKKSNEISETHYRRDQ